MPEPPCDLAPQVAAGVRLDDVAAGLRAGASGCSSRSCWPDFVAPDDFGLMSMAFVVTYLAIMVSDLGVGAALVQRRDLRTGHVTTAFTISTSFGRRPRRPRRA